MNKYYKLLNRFNKMPKDFTFDEGKKLLLYSDFELSNKGKTSGSRVQFSYNNVNIDLHKPHPQKYLKRYQLESIKLVSQMVGIV